MTQFVEFVFSVGGFACAVAAASIWVCVKRSNAARRCLLFIVFAYFLVAIFPLSYRTGRLLSARYRPFTASDQPRGRTALVVLGAGTDNVRDWEEAGVAVPNEAGSLRAVEAARVYRLIDPEWVISSGGPAMDDDPSLAGGQTIRDMLVQLGVPPARILTEITSKTTHDQSEIVRSMLAATPVDHVVLVTSDLHMRRSLGAFRAQGIAAIPAIARRAHARTPWGLDLLPSNAGLDEAREVAREVFGICYYAVRGWYR